MSIFLGGTGSANELDDYEEGTWTPAFKATSGGTSATNVNAASYTKVGNLVFVQCYIDVSSNTNSTGGNWTITGLPYTAQSTNRYFPISVSYWNSLAADITYLTGTVQPNTTQVLMRGASSSAAQSSNLSYSSFVQTGSGIIFSATYLTA
tara:strand:+ start:116 stop:565 length:450 start_codon:yes stop_codon:yes gene_type:complete